MPTPRSRWEFDDTGGFPWILDEGVEVGGGADGEHAFAFGGDRIPVTDDGTSNLVFEGGTGVSQGGSPSIAVDEQGYNDGEIVGPVKAVESPTMSGSGAFEFTAYSDNGTSNYVDMTNANYDISTGFTASAWAYLRSTDDVRNLFEVTPDPEVFYMEFSPTDSVVGDNSMVFVIKNDNETNHKVGASCPTDQYVFWTGVFDGEDVIIYKNGSEADRLSFSGSVESGDGTFFVGADSTPSQNPYQNWDGYIDDPRYFEEPLTATEVSNLYNSYF